MYNLYVIRQVGLSLSASPLCLFVCIIGYMYIVSSSSSRSRSLYFFFFFTLLPIRYLDNLPNKDGYWVAKFSELFSCRQRSVSPCIAC
ncbi:hypothetical protein F4810DRAFT_691653 [Camillea tinctor]|nr:hypothetical protein F4810DRAFT_691653 [Camillea tinctor]